MWWSSGAYRPSLGVPRAISFYIHFAVNVLSSDTSGMRTHVDALRPISLHYSMSSSFSCSLHTRSDWKLTERGRQQRIEKCIEEPFKCEQWDIENYNYQNLQKVTVSSRINCFYLYIFMKHLKRKLEKRSYNGFFFYCQLLRIQN